MAWSMVMCGERAWRSWPLPEGIGDDGLELLLFPAPASASQSDRRPIPDWASVEKELRRRSVTRLLLWEEYRAANPDGFGYTWSCTTFEAWKKRVRPSTRQTHIGGEKVFVDFAGRWHNAMLTGSAARQIAGYGIYRDGRCRTSNMRASKLQR